MNEPTPVLIPLLNPNESEALLASLAIGEGQRVSAGDVLCTLETTKAAADLIAEAEGYVAGLRFAAGQIVRAGEILCHLSASPDWQPPQGETSRQGVSTLPEGLRITQPAVALAARMGLNLNSLPIGPFVTESLVREIIQKSAAFPSLQSDFDPTAILIYGGGGHGKMLIDLMRGLQSYRLIGIVDDGQDPSQSVMGLPVLGGSAILPQLHAQGVRLAANGVGGIGNIAVRIKVFQKLAQAGFVCPTLVHSTATIEPGARLAPGAQAFAHAYVGSEAKVGFGVIVSTGAIISHDCILEDYAILSPGAILAGEVQIGMGVLIGMGATVNLRVKIGSGARIGNGATVKADVPENGIVRAGGIWPP